MTSMPNEKVPGWDDETIVSFFGTLGHLWGMGEDIGDGQVKVPLAQVAHRLLSTEPRPEPVTRWLSGIPEDELHEVAYYVLLNTSDEPVVRKGWRIRDTKTGVEGVYTGETLTTCPGQYVVRTDEGLRARVREDRVEVMDDGVWR